MSDGDLSPSALIIRAAKTGVTLLSITDHDTVAAYGDATWQTAEEEKVELVPGIEISSEDKESGQVIHVIGLRIDPEAVSIRSLCERARQIRTDYLEGVTASLGGLGIIVRKASLLEDGGTITKAHIARDVLSNGNNRVALEEIYGEEPVLQGMFIEDFLIRGAQAYVESKKTPVSEAIEAIRGAGGLAFCAHPSFNVMKGFPLESMKNTILTNGFDGVEALNIQYDKANEDRRYDMVEEFCAFATANGLRISGGSDYHSDDKSLWGEHSNIGLMNETNRLTVSMARAALS